MVCVWGGCRGIRCSRPPPLSPSSAPRDPCVGATPCGCGVRPCSPACTFPCLTLLSVVGGTLRCLHASTALLLRVCRPPSQVSSPEDLGSTAPTLALSTSLDPCFSPRLSAVLVTPPQPLRTRKVHSPLHTAVHVASCLAPPLLLLHGSSRAVLTSPCASSVPLPSPLVVSPARAPLPTPRLHSPSRLPLHPLFCDCPYRACVLVSPAGPVFVDFLCVSHVRSTSLYSPPWSLARVR